MLFMTCDYLSQVSGVVLATDFSDFIDGLTGLTFTTENAEDHGDFFLDLLEIF